MFAQTAVPPFVTLMTDVLLKLLLHVPAMQTKLKEFTTDVNQAYTVVNGVFGELERKLSRNELVALESYFSAHANQTTLVSVLKTGFDNILADGVIDITDSIHFMVMIEQIVATFSSFPQRLPARVVLAFLFFALKAVLVLTLTGKDEAVAVALLEQSFNLVALTVTPGATCKWSCLPWCR
jgi:hypothetical protein